MFFNGGAVEPAVLVGAVDVPVGEADVPDGEVDVPVGEVDGPVGDGDAAALEVLPLELPVVALASVLIWMPQLDRPTAAKPIATPPRNCLLLISLSLAMTYPPPYLACMTPFH